MGGGKITSRPWLLALLAALAVFALYAPSLTGGFAWDGFGMTDDLYPHYYPAFENPSAGPLARLAVTGNQHLWGGSPAGYHLSNVLLHAAAAVLVFFLGMMLIKDRILSFLAALLFAIHPVNSEPVAWVSARPELLMTVFFMGAFASYLKYKESGNRTALVLTGLFFLLSALSRQNVVVFIAMILGFELVQKEGKGRFAHAVGFLVLVGLTYQFLLGGAVAAVRPGITPLSLFGGLGYYIEKLAVPTGLNLMPGVPENLMFFIVALVPFALIGFLLTEGKRLEAFLVAWVVLALMAALISPAAKELPLSGRNLYLPSAGFCLFLAAVLGRVRDRRVLLALASPLLLLFFIGTFSRVQLWRDDVLIWEDTAQKSPRSASAHINYCATLIGDGREEEARRELSLALKTDEITQDEMLLAMDLLSFIGMGESEPEFLDMLTVARGEGQAYYGLGFMYYSLYRRNSEEGMLDKAVEYLEKSVSASPNYMRPHYYLGLSYLERRDWDKAEEHLQIVKELDIDGRYQQETEDFLALIKGMKKRGIIQTST